VKDNGRFVRAYIGALDLVAIYTITSPAKGRVRIGRGKDPTAALKSVRSADPNSTIEVAGWCRADRAEMLLSLIDDRTAAHVDEARERVLTAAEELGIALQTDDGIREIAESTVGHVERTFDEQLRAGALRDLNRRYRAERLARAAAGKGSLSYPRWLENQKLALVLATADATRSSLFSAPLAARKADDFADTARTQNGGACAPSDRGHEKGR
jgi:hypothetical protein